MVGSYSFLEQLRHSFFGVGRVLKRPQWLLVAVIVAFLFSLLMFFLINASFYWPLLTSALPLDDKIGVIGTMIAAMVGEYATTVNGFLLLVVSLLQGVVVASLLYVIRRNRQSNAELQQAARRSGVAALAATFGLGCVPCGTAVILPLVSIIFSGSSAVLAANITSLLLLVIALVLSLYSFYKIGDVAYKYTDADAALKEEV